MPGSQSRLFSHSIAKIVTALEERSVAFSHYFITFLAAVTLRNFLEFLAVQATPPIPLAWHHPLHFTLFYVTLALSVTLLLCALTREKIDRVARIVFASFILTSLPPIADTLLSALFHYPIAYQYFVPSRDVHLWQNYLMFFGDHQGVPPGMRLEIGIALVAAALYVHHKTGSAARAATTAWLLYTLIYWGFGAILYSIEGAERGLGLWEDTTPRMMIDVYLLLSFPLLCACAYLFRPALVRALLRDFRAARVLHYILMIFIGTSLGLAQRGHGTMQAPELVELCLLVIAVMSACIYSAITNNLADLEIDKISNPERPSVTGVIPDGAYRKIAQLLLAASLIYALAAGPLACFLVFCFIGVYYLYSMPPLRLKRIPLLSKAMIALNCLTMMLLGFVWSGQEIGTFPSRIIVFVLIFFTACLNFIDIKDFEGDKAAGIVTLPTLLGVRASRILVGAAFLTTYGAFPLLVGPRDLLPWAIAFGAAIFIALNIGRYRESAVFAFYLPSVGLYLCATAI